MMRELATDSGDSNDRETTTVLSSSFTTSHENSSFDVLSRYEPGLQINLETLQREETTILLFSCSRLIPPTFAARRRVVAMTKMGGILIEFAPNPNKMGYGKVLETHHVSNLSHIKFNRGSSTVVSLTFKNHASLHYQCVDPAPFIDGLQLVLSSLGLHGTRKRNTRDAGHVKTAEDFLSLVQEIEARFSLQPSIRHVDKIMDLLREATELFSLADDDRHRSVLTQIQQFLQREDVIRVLEIAATASGLSKCSSPSKPKPIEPASSSTEQQKRLDTTITNDSSLSPAATSMGTATAAESSSSSAFREENHDSQDATDASTSTSSVGIRLAMQSMLQNRTAGINTANKTKNNTGATPQRILLKNQRKNPLNTNDDDDDQEEEEDEEFSIGTALSSLKLDNQQSQDSSTGGIANGGDTLPAEQLVDGQPIEDMKTPTTTPTTLYDSLDGID